jgi:hypothetical protein
MLVTMGILTFLVKKCRPVNQKVLQGNDAEDCFPPPLHLDKRSILIDGGTRLAVGGALPTAANA